MIYMSVEEPRRVLRKIPAVSPVTTDSFPRFVGYLGFEAGRSFDAGIGRLPPLPRPLATPDCLFGDYRAVLKIDLKKKTMGLIWRGPETASLFSVMARIKTTLSEKRDGAVKTASFHAAQFASAAFDRSEARRFQKMVVRAKESIACGDIYQANLSLRFKRSFSGDPRDLYRDVCAQNPSPYAALLKCGDHWLVSNSPELLIEIRGRRAITRPIAGTRPRGGTPRRDVRRRGQLLLSPKERAEHIMLVDLERNDLGRVCAPGSVKLTESFTVEKYSHVMHIVSQVEGTLSKRKSSIDALKAVFPGGTITGCPKIRSIEVIHSLERVSRGPFYGSAGFISGNGDAVFNILIRTALIKGRSAWVQAGAGIVADSDPAREYREVRAKAAAMLEALERAR